MLIQAFVETKRTERKNDNAEDRECQHLGPKNRDAAALQEDATDYFHKVTRRIEERYVLNGVRHVPDGKRETAQQEARLEKQERGHHSLLLRL